MKTHIITFSILLCFILMGCGHEHIWEDATCLTPMRCTQCGETQGERLSHIFSDATCTKPMRCEICGTTQGQSLGHTTPIGKCERCEILQGTSEIVDILTQLKKSDERNEIISNIIDDFSNTADSKSEYEYYMYMDRLTDNYQALLPIYEEAYTMCNDHAVFQSLKDALENAIDALSFTKCQHTEEGFNNFIQIQKNILIAKTAVNLQTIQLQDDTEITDDFIEKYTKVPERVESEHDLKLKIISYYNRIMDPLNENLSISNEELEKKSFETINALEKKYDLSFEEILMIIGDPDLQSEYYSSH